MASGQVLCAICSEEIVRGPFLLCTHGRWPMHAICLSNQLDTAVVLGLEFRRCDCDDDMEFLQRSMASVSCITDVDIEALRESDARV